jgi:hypothetical protein
VTVTDAVEPIVILDSDLGEDHVQAQIEAPLSNWPKDTHLVRIHLRTLILCELRAAYRQHLHAAERLMLGDLDNWRPTGLFQAVDQ